MNSSSLEFEKTLALFNERRLAVLFDDCASSESAVLCAPAGGIDEPLLNEALHISAGTCLVAMSPSRVKAFMLAPMERPSMLPGGPRSDNPTFPLCVSVEAREGVTTGISVADRTRTILILGEEQPNPRKLVRPGHIFPVEVREGGVLVRNALAEGAFDLARLGCSCEAALFIDLLKKDGEFVSRAHAREVAAAHSLPFFSLSDLIHYRLSTETLVTKVAEARLPSRIADGLRTVLYRSSIHSGEHLALVKGSIDPELPVLTRIQSENTCADVFGGEHPASRKQLHAAMQAIEDNGSGIILYLRRPQRGELREQVESWTSQPSRPTAAELREYGLGAQILRDLGARKIELMTASSRVLEGLGSFELEIVSQRSIPGFDGAGCE